METNDIQNIVSQIPSKVMEVLQIIHNHGVQSLLVGGQVRDFILHGKFLKHDYDIELRFKSEASFKEDYPLILADLKLVLGISGMAQAYHTYQFKIKELEIDLTPAREEIFSDHLKGHKNFEINILYSPSDEVAFKRRDFTLNAIGLLYNPLNTKQHFFWADPFKGINHLEKRLLFPCSDDFSKDPVRFLRAFRFMADHQLKLSDSLKEILGQMDLGFLELPYFWRELSKCKNKISFLKNIFSHSNLKTLNLNQNLSPLMLLKDAIKKIPLSYTPGNISNLCCSLWAYSENPQRIEIKVFLLTAPGMTPDDFHAFCTFVETLENTSPQFYIPLLELEFSDFLKSPSLEIFLKLNRHLTRYPEHLPCLPLSILSLWLPLFEKLRKKISITYPKNLSVKDRSPYTLWCLIREKS